MVYRKYGCDKLYDSSHPKAVYLDRLYKDVDVCYGNYQNVMVDYQKGVGVTPSDVNQYFKELKNHYKRYKKAFKEAIENSDSDSSDEDEYEEDFIDDRETFFFMRFGLKNFLYIPYYIVCRTFLCILQRELV